MSADDRSPVLIPVPAQIHSHPGAELALRNEGEPISVVICGSNWSYGQEARQHIEHHRELLLVEHDVAPWPGAIHELRHCHHPYCALPYHAAPGKLIHALGVFRISPQLADQIVDADLHTTWSQTPWNQLDARIYLTCRQATGREAHLHHPGAAHLKPRP